MENNKGKVIYDEDFYQGQYEGSIRSAKVYLDYLFSLYRPNSIVDFGCGVGCWLSVAELHGINDLVGLDGTWVSKKQLISENINLIPSNFEDEINLQRTFDLAISLEVAEHFEDAFSDQFINNICQASNVVLFGAAIPHQGGLNHINEKPQKYWIDKFSSRGFRCLDLFRHKFWEDRSVEYWYRQNTFLFVKESYITKLFPGFEKFEVTIPNAIHHQLFNNKVASGCSALDNLPDLLRDAATALETDNINLAYALIQHAHSLRPNGPHIKKHLIRMKGKLSGK